MACPIRAHRNLLPENTFDAEGKQELAGSFRTSQRSQAEITDQAEKLLGIWKVGIGAV